MAQYKRDLGIGIDTDYPEEIRQALEWATDEVLRLDTENIGLRNALWKMTQENDYLRERLKAHGEVVPTREEAAEAATDWGDESTASYS